MSVKYAAINSESISYLAIDELQIARALRITVSNTILSSSLVSRVSAHSTILVHGHEVKRAIETARKVGDIHIEGELVVQEVELLVRGIGVHKIEARPNIGSILSNSDELKLEGISACGSTVCGSVIGSLKSTVGRTS